MFDLLVFYLLFIFVRFPVFYVLDIGYLVLNMGLGIFSFHGLCGCLVTNKIEQLLTVTQCLRDQI